MQVIRNRSGIITKVECECGYECLLGNMEYTDEDTLPEGITEHNCKMKINKDKVRVIPESEGMDHCPTCGAGFKRQASEAAKLIGSRGGKASAKSMTAEQKKARSLKGVKARWKNK